MYTTNSLYKHANYDINQTIYSQMLSDSQCEEIYVTALDLLERSGTKVTNKKAREILSKNGCIVEDDIVYLSTAKVQDALQKAPFRVTLNDRLGNKRVLMETCNSQIGPGVGAEKVLDKDKIRAATMDDLKDTAIVAEALKQMDFIAPAVAPKDGGKAAALCAFKTLTENSTKPIVMPAQNAAEAEALYQMAAVAVGGEARLCRMPYLALCTGTNQSMQHDDDALDVVIAAAEKNLPVIYTGDFVSGLTAPYTQAGTLVVALAADLFALVLSQSVRSGAPFVFGGKFSINDEVNKATPVASPENGLANFGFANIARYLDMPCACQSGSSDSFISDTQLGMDSTYGIVSASLAGANVVFGCGAMGSGKVFSLSSLALCDEIGALIRRIMKSGSVDEDRIGRGVIGEISPAGNYLGTEHTNVFFKSEQYWPNLQTRKRIDDWLEDGGKTMGQRAEIYVTQLLTGDNANPLTAEQTDKLAAIVASF